MRFITLQENIKKGISVVGHINSKNINLPILGNILIKAEEGEIKLISTNLEIGIIYSLRGKVEEVGDATVDAKLISEYVNIISGEKVEIKNDGLDLDVECGAYKTKIRGEDTKDFPLIPVISGDNYFSCKIELLKKALSSVAFAVSSNENRVEISGVLFNITGDKLKLVATDSYRLAEYKIDIRNSGVGDQSIIIPSRTAQEVLRIISNLNPEAMEDGNNQEVKIYISDNQVMFSVDSVTLVSRLINGHYPDYNQIIPDKNNTEIVVSKPDFIRAIKASAIFSRSGINDVYLKVSGDELLISSSSSQSGESIVNIAITKKGNDNQITLNHRYLLDGLNNIPGDNVIFKLVDENIPCSLLPQGMSDYIYIVMPIRQ